MNYELEIDCIRIMQKEAVQHVRQIHNTKSRGATERERCLAANLPDPLLKLLFDRKDPAGFFENDLAYLSRDKEGARAVEKLIAVAFLQKLYPLRHGRLSYEKLCRRF